MTERIVTRAIILNKFGEVLLGKKVRGIGQGQWALIGGKPDKGETLEEAIAREVKEETGLNLSEPKLWREVLDTSSDPDSQWRTYYFNGRVKGKLRLKKDEIEKVIFASKEQLSELEIAFDHKEILLEIFEEMSKNSHT